ncbi:MAG: beta-ketoacyl synthase N-terminal-like domain-containing protein [Cytophagaceae bacterium]
MRSVYLTSDNIISSLGFTSLENFNHLKNGVSGVACVNDPEILSVPFYASRVSDEKLNTAFATVSDSEAYTRLEKMFITSIASAVDKSEVDPRSPKVLFLISTTKGNIDLLHPQSPKFGPERLKLAVMASKISGFFGNPNEPVVLSNACISGAMAILVGKRFIESGAYDSVIVSGGDLVSEFTVSGFYSFKALGTSACKPYDESRDGISLGEGCGTVILSSRDSDLESKAKVVSGAVSNDANHISGPSRTGEGLNIAITKALKAAVSVKKEDIGYVSAHGTATLYNDEMEAKAFASSGLDAVPLNSLKGYFGHTLGAAGVIESIMAVWSMINNTLIPSIGYNNCGTSVPLNIIRESSSVTYDSCLKTASGFGGCNVAVVFSK